MLIPSVSAPDPSSSSNTTPSPTVAEFVPQPQIGQLGSVSRDEIVFCSPSGRGACSRSKSILHPEWSRTATATTDVGLDSRNVHIASCLPFGTTVASDLLVLRALRSRIEASRSNTNVQVRGPG